TTLSTLERIAAEELRAEPLTAEEQEFLEKAIDQRGSVSVGSGSRPRYDGWYCDLYYDRFLPTKSAMRWDPTSAGVHTNPESSTVLEGGVGNVNFCVIAIDSEQDRMAYVGPVYAYCEFRHSAEDRLTDQQWQERIAKHQLPERPEWTRTFQGPPLKRAPKGAGPTTMGEDGDIMPASLRH
ncbi:MAG: DUF3160 domain-containing protein, partial [Planctomycetota bacterium]